VPGPPALIYHFSSWQQRPARERLHDKPRL
jgi:hypothetical protein